MRQLASSWNVLPTQSLARVRVTGFYQVEFIDCLSSVNVCLNWKKMAAEWWPVSIEEINSEPETHALYIPKYMLHGRLVPYDTPGASPLQSRKGENECSSVASMRTNTRVQVRGNLFGMSCPSRNDVPRLPSSKFREAAS